MKKFLSILLACAVLLGIASFGVMALTKSEEQNVVFRTNDPRYVLNGEVAYHDNQNSGVTPTIHQERTLVPLRSIADALGADVSYDTQNRQAIIKLDGKTIAFPIEQSHMLINGAQQDIDTQCIIVNDRAMVPLRALAQQALGLSVLYDDGYILIGKDTSNAAAQSALANAKEKLGSLKYYATHQELKTVIDKELGDESNKNVARNSGGGGASASAPQDAALAENTTKSYDSVVNTDQSSSQTNVQVAGVDEADVVKTDGEFLYYLAERKIFIVKALESGEMELASVIEADEDMYFRDMYIDGDKMAVSGGAYYRCVMPLAENNLARDTDGMYKNFSSIYVYDISDKNAPYLVKSTDLEGYEVSTRKIDNLVYLITQKYVYRYEENGDYVPTYRDSTKGGGAIPIEANKIAVMPNPIDSSYLNIAVIDLSDDSSANIESVLGSGNNVYMNQESLFIAANAYEEEKSYTDVVYFELNGHSVIPQDKARVEGYVIDQFSMDEHNGYFRIATTNWNDEGSNLFVIDKSTMEVVGKITGIAPEERIYSARFDGDKGYIVTFKQVDPLFAIDLSDPANPVITGQLKVPGYSSYLHPLKDNLVLGIGRDVKETYIINDKGEEEAVGTLDDGLKLSLFDVSSGTPVELDTVKITDSRNVYTEAQNNHKAMMVDPQRRNIGFSVREYKDTKDISFGLIFNIDSDKKLSDAVKLPVDEQEEYTYFGQDRLCYIGDVLYYINDGIIYSYDYNNYSPITSLNIK